MTLYDTRVPIHETPGSEPSIDESIDKLDEMLNQYEISHCFTLPTEREMDATKRDLKYYLCYCSENDDEVTLIVNLYAKLHLKKSRQKILRSIVKSFAG